MSVFWVFLVGIILLAIVATIMYRDHIMKQQWQEASHIDTRLAREAAEHSVMASELKNPMLALMEAVKAYRTTEILLRRYGNRKAQEVTEVDVQEMRDTYERQIERIMDHIMEMYPDMIVKHDYRHYLRQLDEREESRVSGVAHVKDPI